ncbi:MAG: hypothetical protein QOH05_1356 [Acetobacteraceae bacterium]|jgi:hypothetical protein|nr:hypothetical protein [Acetobacteraceae bacterium]
MTVFGRSASVMFVGLLIAAPTFAQTSQQAPQGQTQTQTSQVQKQRTQDGNSPTTVGPASGAYKQRTQGDLPEVGPASGAYNGNTPHSRY